MIESVATAPTQTPAADPVCLSTSECELLQVYANAEQQHLALENGVVMGIARIRLIKDDFKTNSEGMKSQRGVVH